MRDNAYDTRCFCIASSHKFLNENASVHTARCMSIWSKVQSSNKMCFLWRGSTVLPHWLKPHSKLTHISCTPILHAVPVMQHMITTHCRILPHNTSRESVMQLKSDVITHHHPPCNLYCSLCILTTCNLRGTVELYY